MQKHPTCYYNVDNVCEHHNCNRKWQVMLWIDNRPVFLCADDADYALMLRDGRKDKAQLSKFTAECNPLK